MTSLAFSPPSRVGDGGPWWQGVQRLSNSHAVGAVPHGKTVATIDGGKTWQTLDDFDGVGAYGGIYTTADGSAFHNVGDHKFVSPTGENVNVTGVTAPSTVIVSLAGGSFTHNESGRAFSMSGLPFVHGLRVGPGGASLWLRDGSVLLTTVTSGIGAARSQYLSVVALHSHDAGYSWTYTGVVASADEVPYAHEGPSENAVAYLTNGSLLCVMRVQGENGHHSPYISKISDDEGRSWKYLRSLSPWPGESIAPGCVLPRLLRLNGSLVLAGGRPSPSSHDVMLWLNARGDGEAWRPYSVSYWHDRLITNQSWAWPPNLVNRSWPRYDTSYTSLVRTGSTSAYLVYGTFDTGFALPLRLAA